MDATILQTNEWIRFLPLCFPSSSKSGQRHEKQEISVVILSVEECIRLVILAMCAHHPAAMGLVRDPLDSGECTGPSPPFQPHLPPSGVFIFSTARLPWLHYPALTRSHLFLSSQLHSCCSSVPNTLPGLNIPHLHVFFVSPLSSFSGSSSLRSIVCPRLWGSLLPEAGQFEPCRKASDLGQVGTNKNS